MSRQDLVTFLHEHNGWCWNPATETQEQGRQRCAQQGASAYLLALESECTWEWRADFDADLSWMDAEELQKPHVVEGCILRDRDGHVLTSLWGIVDADETYRRCVEVDLASEAEAELMGPLLSL